MKYRYFLVTVPEDSVPATTLALSQLGQGIGFQERNYDGRALYDLWAFLAGAFSSQGFQDEPVVEQEVSDIAGLLNEHFQEVFPNFGNGDVFVGEYCFGAGNEHRIYFTEAFNNYIGYGVEEEDLLQAPASKLREIFQCEEGIDYEILYQTIQTAMQNASAEYGERAF